MVGLGQVESGISRAGPGCGAWEALTREKGAMGTDKSPWPLAISEGRSHGAGAEVDVDTWSKQLLLGEWGVR